MNKNYGQDVYGHFDCGVKVVRWDIVGCIVILVYHEVENGLELGKWIIFVSWFVLFYIVAKILEESLVSRIIVF